MSIEKQKDKIIEQLELLNAEIVKQKSVKQTLYSGIIYGIGFFIGSAIVATIILGVLSPFFSKIDWVHDNFERGSSLVN